MKQKERKHSVPVGRAECTDSCYVHITARNLEMTWTARSRGVTVNQLPSWCKILFENSAG